MFHDRSPPSPLPPPSGDRQTRHSLSPVSPPDINRDRDHIQPAISLSRTIPESEAVAEISTND